MWMSFRDRFAFGIGDSNVHDTILSPAWSGVPISYQCRRKETYRKSLQWVWQGGVALQSGAQNVLGFGNEAFLFSVSSSWRLEIATPPERRNVASRGSVDCPWWYCINTKRRSSGPKWPSIPSGNGARIAFDCLALKGRLVEMSATGARDVTFNLADFYHNESHLIGIDTLKLGLIASAKVLNALAPGFEAGEYQPAPNIHRFPLHQSVAAYQAGAAGEPGRVVLRPRGLSHPTVASRQVRSGVHQTCTRAPSCLDAAPLIDHSWTDMNRGARKK
jgi:hypothetical protein